jgi:hypothetical protein
MFQVSASVVGAPYMHLRSLAFSGLGLIRSYRALSYVIAVVH